MPRAREQRPRAGRRGARAGRARHGSARGALLLLLAGSLAHAAAGAVGNDGGAIAALSAPGGANATAGARAAESRSSHEWIALGLYPLGIFLCFVALAIVCDDYLAPALEELVERWKIPHDVGSATFLAFGSSAPEISINCVATVHGKVNMSLGAVLGSGIIAYTVIPAACVLVSRGQVLRLESIPLLRDVLFYGVAIVMFVVFTAQGSFGAAENASLLAVFGLYLVALWALGFWYHSALDDAPAEGEQAALVKPNFATTAAPAATTTNGHASDAIGQVALEKPRLLTRYKTVGDAAGGVVQPGALESGPGNNNYDTAQEGQAELEGAEDCLSGALEVVAMPIRLVFRATIPPFCPVEEAEGDGDDEVGGSFEIGNVWPATMIVSLVYVSLLSELVLVLTSGFADAIGLPHHTAGLTILALGAQVPDLFASVSVAKKGEGPSSISNAVGSQIINILVGVGAPFLVYNLQHGVPIQVETGPRNSSNGLTLTGVMLFVLVGVFLGLCFRHVYRHSHVGERRKPSLTSLDAVILAAMYVLTLTVLVSSEALS